MEKALLKTPVLFIIYNRPNLTFMVFDEIKKARPERLYIAADGPKMKKDEVSLCQQARTVINRVNWNCTIKTNFQKHNIGCKYNVSNAINWFFENEEEGVIIEDDCLPHPGFFHYCSLLLDKYRNDFTIGHIGGNNFLNNANKPETYFFSKYSFIWGWATWRRTWKLYDISIRSFPETLVNDSFSRYFNSNFEKYTFYNKFYQVFAENKNTWDYQWLYTLWYNNLKSIVPPVNFIINLGFDSRATHTKRKVKAANLNLQPIIDVKHPESCVINSSADAYFYKNLFERHFISNIYLNFKLNYIKLKYYGRYFKKNIPSVVSVFGE